MLNMLREMIKENRKAINKTVGQCIACKHNECCKHDSIMIHTALLARVPLPIYGV